MSKTQKAITPYYQLKLEYWQELRQRLLENNSVLSTYEPRPQGWYNFRLKKDAFLVASVHSEREKITVILRFLDNEEKNFAYLHKNKDAIEKEIGTALDWRDRARIYVEGSDEELYSRAGVRLDKWKADSTNRAEWPDQQAWFQTTLESFYNVFTKYLDQYTQHSGATTCEETLCLLKS